MTTTQIKLNTDAHTDAKPLKSPLGYLAWVYFTKSPSRVEILNDRDGELVKFWSVIRHHLPEFLRCLDFSMVSREQFEMESRQDPTTMTDVQRAVRYYRLQRMGFGGKTTKRNFGTSTTRPNSLNLLSVEEKLKKTHQRMARTTVENLDACDCIKRYDSPETLFYIDPPYWEADFYAVSFKGDDFKRLAETLRTINGKFILSLNDTPEVRAIFADFQIESIETKYSLANSKVASGTRGVDRKEVLIKNF